MALEASSDFATFGAQRFRGAFKRCIATVEDALATIPIGEAGHRLHGIKALDPVLANDGCIGAVAESILGASAKPVRAILFDKSAEANWSLAWHQDRTISVKERRETPGFGPWTIKQGLHHVAPPPELLTRMITLRAHLDDVPSTNAPLLIAPRSQAFGRVPVECIARTVDDCGTVACLAEAGDIWLYATLILHASEKASVPARRRVLQVDYAAEELPGGLEWLGV